VTHANRANIFVRNFFVWVILAGAKHLGSGIEFGVNF
jgi:hypothetical protein